MIRITAVATPIALALLAACSPESYRKEADEEVYAIVDSLSEEVYGEKRTFSIDEPEDTLRARYANAEESAVEPLQLDLRLTLEIAFSNSRNYQDQKENVYLAALSLTQARWNFERNYVFGGGADVAGTHDVSGNASIFETLGITQALEFGGRLGLSLGNTISRSFIMNDDWSFGSVLQATFELPLLSGAGREIAREPLTQAERSALYAVRSFRRFNQTFSVSVASQFYRVLQNKDQLKNARANLESLSVSVEEQNEKLKAGRVTRVEVDQTLQDQLRAEQSVISSQAALENSLDQLKLTLNLPITLPVALLDHDLDQLRAEGLKEVRINEEIARAIALASREDLRVSEGRFEDTERQVTIAADALEAGLDISGRYTLPTEDTNPVDFETNLSSYSFGVAYDLPIDRLPERNNYRSSLIALEQSRRALSLDRDQIELEVRDGLRTLEAARQSYKIQLAAQKLAETRVESSRLFQDAGRATTRDYLESQRSLVESQDDTTSALIAYTISRLELARDLGILKILVGDSSFDDNLDKYQDS